MFLSPKLSKVHLNDLQVSVRFTWIVWGSTRDKWNWALNLKELIHYASAANISNCATELVEKMIKLHNLINFKFQDNISKWQNETFSFYKFRRCTTVVQWFAGMVRARTPRSVISNWRPITLLSPGVNLNGALSAATTLTYQVTYSFSTSITSVCQIKTNKKILLRNRKRRTARGVAPLALRWGYPLSCPLLARVPAPRTPPPGRTWNRTSERTRCTPQERTVDQRLGYPPPLWTDTHLWKYNLPSYYVRGR